MRTCEQCGDPIVNDLTVAVFQMEDGVTIKDGRAVFWHNDCYTLDMLDIVKSVLNREGVVI